MTDLETPENPEYDTRWLALIMYLTVFKKNKITVDTTITTDKNS